MLSWAADYQEGPVAIRYPQGAAIHSLEHQEPVQFDPFPVKIHSHEGKIALVALEMPSS